MEPLGPRLGGLIRRGLPLLVPLALACGQGAWRNADLQLDVRGALPPEAERVRICVEGAGMRTLEAGPDRYAFPELPADRSAVVIVDALVEDDPWNPDTGDEALAVVARAGPARLDGDVPWREVVLVPEATSAPCTASAVAEAEEESWLLAVRFMAP